VLVLPRCESHCPQIKIFLHVYTGVNGAVFLAVFRGKISEGMDFKDNYARAVITVSLKNITIFTI
jgi:hypothetical protein